jgi:GAF domain-containing protein
MSEHRSIDFDALERSLVGLRDRPGGEGLTETLDRVLAATRELFDATGAGFMMVDENSALSVVSATDAPGRWLELRQEQTGRGPCVDALTLGRVVMTSDLAEDDRWPELSAELAQAGVRAVLGVPIHAHLVPVGSLNVYRDRRGEWGDAEVRALEAYGEIIGTLLVTALQARQQGRLAMQLQHALDNRVTIERAVGVIMARERLAPVDAFNRLRVQARSEERRVADVAAELLGQITRGP